MRLIRGYVKRRGDTWYAVWQADGRTYSKSTGETARGKAEARLRELVAPFQAADRIATLRSALETAQERQLDFPVGGVSLADVWLRFEQSPARPDCGAENLANYRQQWADFARWCLRDAPGVQRLDQITPQVAAAYAGHLTSAVGPSTFNRHRGCLLLVYGVVSGAGRGGRNPFVGIRRKVAQPTPRRALSQEELAAALAAAPDRDLHDLLVVGACTGLRLGDCATLGWAEVDLAAGLIRRVPSKSSRRSPVPVLVPIHPDLRALLDRRHRGQTAGHVLPAVARTYREDRAHLCNRLQAVFVAAGLKIHGAKAAGRKRAPVVVGFHSLRHTFVSRCAEAGVPAAVVQSIVGHAAVAMPQHYTHVGASAAQHAISALGKVRKADTRGDARLGGVDKRGRVCCPKCGHRFQIKGGNG